VENRVGDHIPSRVEIAKHVQAVTDMAQSLERFTCDLTVEERKRTLKAFGAELILTPRSGGMEYARDLAEQMQRDGKGRVLDQFANAKPFAERYRMNYPVLDGVDRKDIDDAFGRLVVALPTSLLIGRDGRICRRHVGLPVSASPNIPIDRAVREKFEAEIKSLL